uniref:Transcription factor 25 n=2 Tax=Plectus sambesii TaxID=2011161 RepID=A0A914UX17_9BILA
MSTKHLKKALAQKEAVAEAADADRDENDEDEEDSGAKPERKNLFALLQEDEEFESEDPSDKNAKDPANTTNVGSSPDKTAKKRKKKNKKKQASTKEAEDADNFDKILLEYGADRHEMQTGSGNEGEGKDVTLMAEAELFKIDYRNMNPDSEMRRILGAKFRINDQAPETRRKGGRISGKLVQRKAQWPPLKNTGLSMSQVQVLSGEVRVFAFEHGAAYQTAQQMFWEAVDSMNPDAFVAILREYPYHIDTLLQLAEVVRANEDFQMARDLVERALFVCESSLHPLFNLSTYRSRLDYRQWENRPFFLALHRHIAGLCQRGLYRTALEFVKLLFSLDPLEDPLGMLLLIDYVALRARQYDYLLSLYRGLEISRNVSQLPNFAYSVALGCFLKTIDEDQPTTTEDENLADELLQDALLRFPTLLLPLLDKCSVEPDKKIENSRYFSAQEQVQDSEGLKQLVALYVARSHELWKEAAVMRWLEKNAHSLLEKVEAKKATLERFRQIRRTRYQRTPRNVLRHLFVSDLREAMAALPAAATNEAVLSYDPLPPLDSRAHYQRPDRTAAPLDGTFLSGLLRSLMPDFNPDDAAAAQAAAREDDEAGAVGGQPAPAGFQNSIRTLLNAVRDLLDNVQVVPPERDDGAHPPPADEHPEDGEWD